MEIGIRFSGKVVNGRGGHVELGVPGRPKLTNAPANWPEIPCPGSLNILVSEYPIEFEKRGIGNSTLSLDTAGFRPAFMIAVDAMDNNRLRPMEGMPHKGTAQVWRAILHTQGVDTSCWVLRRFGSGLAKELELVSEHKLRDELHLSRDDEWPATVTVFGTWSR